MSESKHPHDHFFKSIFSKRQVMLDYIRQFLPKEIWKYFDLRTLKLSQTSYIDEKLEENFSDLVYTCIWKGKERIQICLLLEHKSYPVKYPHIQLLRYMVNSWEADLDSKKSPRPIIPIVFYHGKKKWHYRPFENSFGEAGMVLQQFIPKFEYHLTDLSHHPDEFILGLKRGFLINSLLVMKHKSDKSYIFENVDRIFLYSEHFMENPQGERAFQQILTYIIQITRMDVKTFTQFTKSLTQKIQPMANTTYDNILKHGEEIGKEIGREELIGNIIKNAPELTDDYIANLIGVDIELVKRVREKTKL